MTNKAIISTDQAPSAIGTYSQAVKTHHTVYLSGQIALDPNTMEMVNDSFASEAHQVFKNMQAVTQAANGSLDNIVKLTIYLKSFDDFDELNTIMANYFREPYPARVAIGVNELPKNGRIEIDGIMVI